MEKELKWIKKHYSESLMKICREHFAEILETNGLLTKILSEHFYPHKCLGDDILKSNNKSNFINYINAIYSKENINKVANKVYTTNESVAEILKKENYTIYECTTNSELNSFEKYYENNERLCSFRSNRLLHSDIFFLIKDNYNDIKRSTTPSREDSYSTSVLCVQFTKGSINNISIISRYNHTVNNPNCVHGNDLNKISKNLRNAFINEYNYNLSNGVPINFFMDDYININNRHYKYNLEVDGIYYCLDNIVIKHGKIIEYDKSNYLLVESYLFDLKKNDIKSLTGNDRSFPLAFNDIYKIKITNEKDADLNKIKKIIVWENDYDTPSTLLLNDVNEIVSVDMPNLEYTGDNFLVYSKKIEAIHFENIKGVIKNFLYSAKYISFVDMPNLQNVGDNFLYYNENLFSIDFKNLEYTGDNFLYTNENIETVHLPNLEITKTGFLANNNGIIDISLPNLKIAGDSFLSKSRIKYFEANNLTKINDYFLQKNKVIEILKLPKVEIIGSEFLSYNKTLKTLELPLCNKVGNGFMKYNNKLKNYNFKNIINIGQSTLIIHPYISSDLIIIKNQKRLLREKYSILELIKLHHNNIPKIINFFTSKEK